MSTVTTSSHAYGIGIITVIVGLAAGLVFYQMFYLPEFLATPDVPKEILEPEETTEISIIEGSSNKKQQDNFVPKLVNIQLGLDNHVAWYNEDQTAHTVTPDPDSHFTDLYSGKFGSSGVIMPGETYEFLFTGETQINYHCEPHPWMTGKLVVTKQRF